MTDTPRPHVLIVFGGRSGEHEISCATAAGILRAIDRTKWDVLPIGITKDGEWVRVPDDPSLFELRDGKGQSVQAGDTRVTLTEGGARLLEVSYGRAADGGLGEAGDVTDLGPVDVVLPLLHGPYGEDGTIQGLFEMANVRYVGCGVAASAISMDKHLTKTVLKAAGIEVGRWELITPRQWDVDPQGCRERVAALGFPVFVKPCRAGSSIGISRVDSVEELSVAIKEARNSDPRVIVEAAVVGREIECGVLQGRGDQPPRTAPLGEIVLSEGAFYDYDSKYIDTEAVGLVCPADVPEADAARLHEAAARTFEALECEGLARVDFFYVPDTHEVIVNEVNTMPGFTPYSMFPLMWAQAGIEYADLVDELLEGALQRDLGLR
ncbi:D-alanine--D-alanine ligase family protein [Actinomyces sp.]|uniref:D-alanine--D-alanine ligase family protein n=1 Tax=Actinomyces sp. TaxID=29317 RepID=UPI0028991274|nr:D-alanine--D-alanine ligase family protein [Actinomyces sp.]